MLSKCLQTRFASSWTTPVTLAGNQRHPFDSGRQQHVALRMRPLLKRWLWKPVLGMEERQVGRGTRHASSRGGDGVDAATL